MVVLIFVICTLTAQAATQKPESVIDNLLTTDVLGYTCVAEENLDAAFLNGGKGASVPQTCISEAPTKDCATLTPLMGREATYDECATYAYKWLSTFDPEKKTNWGWDCSAWDCTIPVQPPSAVPLPGSALLLIGALGFFTLVRKPS